MKNYEMPVGFSMALALNSEAMQKFAMADDRVTIAIRTMPEIKPFQRVSAFRL